ncbi:unnamed protein product, partial [Phaeothamnion confervicola]
VTLLLAVKNVSMEPAALHRLEAAGAVATLVPLLARTGGPADKDRCIAEESHLKQFALQIVCDLAHTGAATRDILWAQDGVPFYLAVIDNPRDRHWHVTALRSLSAWLLADTERVEASLTEPAHLRTVLALFRSAEAAEFEKVTQS